MCCFGFEAECGRTRFSRFHDCRAGLSLTQRSYPHVCLFRSARCSARIKAVLLVNLKLISTMVTFPLAKSDNFECFSLLVNQAILEGRLYRNMVR